MPTSFVYKNNRFNSQDLKVSAVAPNYNQPKGAKKEPKVGKIQHKTNIKDKVAKSMDFGREGLYFRDTSGILFGAIMGAISIKNDEKVNAKIDVEKS